MATSGVKENILATLEVTSLKAVSLVLWSGKFCLQRFSYSHVLRLGLRVTRYQWGLRKEISE